MIHALHDTVGGGGTNTEYTPGAIRDVSRSCNTHAHLVGTSVQYRPMQGWHDNTPCIGRSLRARALHKHPNQEHPAQRRAGQDHLPLA